MMPAADEPMLDFPPGRLLYPPGAQSPSSAEDPECFPDLHLDQIVDAVLNQHDDRDLVAHFRVPLENVDAVIYRQEIFRDLESEPVRGAVDHLLAHSLRRKFDARMKAMRDDDQGLTHYFRARMLLNDAKSYCDAVTTLGSELRLSAPRSPGMRDFLSYLTAYLESDTFTRMSSWAEQLIQRLSDTTYCISIKGDRLTVAAYDGEPDYGEQLVDTLEPFCREMQAREPASSRQWDMYGATGVLDLVSRLYPELFASLDSFCTTYLSYPDPAVLGFEHDVGFYVSYLDHIAPLRKIGLELSYPQMSRDAKDEQALDSFDLALAHRLQGGDRVVVCNNLVLNEPERILVVSGPNNGGKTTFARMFGQLHYLARLGCPVPGHDVHLHLADQIFTHFERAEADARTGRLQGELDRLWADLERATPHSVFILNEVFASTTANDALALSRRIIERLNALDSLGVAVTFLDELSRTSDRTVSMVSTVAPDDPAVRTYKVVRRRADGRAYALAIAKKYGLTFADLTQEICR